MKYSDFVQQLSPKQNPHAQTKDHTTAEKSLAKAGITPDAPYYAGALRQVEQAFASRKPTSEAFWKSYQLSLCAHLEQLEHTDKETEKDMIQTSIRTVQGILYALEQCKQENSCVRQFFNVHQDSPEFTRISKTFTR